MLIRKLGVIHLYSISATTAALLAVSSTAPYSSRMSCQGKTARAARRPGSKYGPYSISRGLKRDVILFFHVTPRSFSSSYPFSPRHVLLISRGDALSRNIFIKVTAQ